jgi:oligopeptide transport system ATP-binding protein
LSELLLEVQNLTKYFTLNGDLVSRIAGKTQILKAVDDISFVVNQGETLGLVGESGCGKSTTGRLITRLVEPTSGAIRLKGEGIC